jgi:transposase InsO family protein
MPHWDRGSQYTSLAFAKRGTEAGVRPSMGSVGDALKRWTGPRLMLILRHVIGRIRARWPAAEIVVRGDSHYGWPEARTWCERHRVGYIFGLAGSPVLLRRVSPLAEDAALGRLAGEGEKVRHNGDSAMPPRVGRPSAALSPASRQVSRVPTAA